MNFKKSSNLASYLFSLLLVVGFILLFVWIFGNPSLRGASSAVSQAGDSPTPSPLAAELVTSSTLIATTQITPPLPVMSVTQRTAGAGTIVEVNQSPYPAIYAITNNWFADIDGKRIRVFAGAQRSDGGHEFPKPWPSFVGVWVWAIEDGNLINPISDESGFYLAPTNEGVLRIVDADGMQLTLTAESGKAFFFNVSSRKFVFPGPKLPVQRAGGDGVITESGDFPNLGSLNGRYKFSNYWSKVQGDEVTNVLAGKQLPEDPNGVTRGVVALVNTSKDQQTVISEEIFEMPLGVSILEATGDRITLYANGILRFVFDVDLRQFINWPEIPAEILTPPTPGPSSNIPKKTAAPASVLDTPAPSSGMPYPYPPGYP